MAEATPVIVVTARFNDSALARLRAHGEVVQLDRPSEEEIMEALRQADALLVRTCTQVTSKVIAAAPRLQVIGRGGVGLENIDLAAARRRGITVVYTPAAATRSVAEHTLALILAVERKLAAGAQAVRAGHTFLEFRGSVRFRELGDHTLGVVGMGRIGSAVGRICARGFGMRVLYNDVVPVGPFDFPAVAVSKEQLYAESDVVSLHVPLDARTRGLIDEAALQRFSPGAVLINTSRGGVVNTDALARALRSGRLAGAGLDVFEPEPLPPTHPLLAAPNAVLSPHVAARSGPGLERMNDVVDDVLAVLQGRAPEYSAEQAGE
jgi:D-3-phosphoglycerate dehydrogenase